MKKITFEEIIAKCNNNEYNTKLPYSSYRENKSKREAYDVDNNRLYEEFKNDLEIAFDMQNNPKKDLLFRKAWEDGHSSGYHEVANCYFSLLELVNNRDTIHINKDSYSQLKMDKIYHSKVVFKDQQTMRFAVELLRYCLTEEENTRFGFFYSTKNDSALIFYSMDDQVLAMTPITFFHNNWKAIDYEFYINEQK